MVSVIAKSRAATGNSSAFIRKRDTTASAACVPRRFTPLFTEQVSACRTHASKTISSGTATVTKRLACPQYSQASPPV